MRSEHYFSIIGAIYMAPTVHDSYPNALCLIGVGFWLISIAVHLFLNEYGEADGTMVSIHVEHRDMGGDR